MKIVPAGFGNDDDLRSGIESILRRITARQHAKFLHRFDRRAERNRVDACFRSDYAVKRAVFIGFTLPVGDKGETDTRNRYAVGPLALPEALPISAGTWAVLHAGLQNRQRSEVAIVERQFFDAALLNRLSERRIISFQDRPFGSNFDAFRRRANLHAKINSNFFVDLQNNPAPHFLLES